MRREIDPNKARRRKIRRVVIVEILFMAAGVVVVLLPLPWRLAALIVLGARGIIVKARAQVKALPPIETAVETEIKRSDKKKEKEQPVRGNAGGRTEKFKDKTRAEKRGKQKL